MENSLDAAESISQLPDIDVTMYAYRCCCQSQVPACYPLSVLRTVVTAAPRFREEMSQRRLNDIRGVENHERLDEELYQDFETEADRKVWRNETQQQHPDVKISRRSHKPSHIRYSSQRREAKDAKELEKLAKLAAKVRQTLCVPE